MNSRFTIRLMASTIVVVCGLVTGCQPKQPPTLSLEAARKVQAEFQGQTGFDVPPRTISDITAILDQYKPDPTKLDEARQKADAKPSSNLTQTQLSDFLYERAQAAGEIGRLAQREADAREAVRLGLASKNPKVTYIQLYLSTAALDMGNFRQAAQILEGRLSMAVNRSQMARALTTYARGLTLIGALDEARRRIDEAAKIVDQLRPSSNPQLQSMIPAFDHQLAQANAVLAQAEGRYADAERFSRIAVATVKGRAYTPDVLDAMIEGGGQKDSLIRNELLAVGRLARILTVQGKLVEAESHARSVLITSLGSYGRYSPNAAFNAQLLAGILYKQGRYADAGRLADIVIETYRSLGADKGSVGLAGGFVLRGRVQAIQGDPKAALASFAAARDLFADDETLRMRIVESDTAYGSAMLAAGQARLAIAFFEKMAAVMRAQFGARNYLTAQARGYLGAALAATGERDRALAEFAAAVPILLQTSRQSEDEGRGGDRDRQLQQILEAYIDLLSTFRPGERADLDPAAEAFRIADAARAQGVQRALAESAARASIRDQDLASLVRQEQDARKQVAALFGLLTNILSSPKEEQDEAATLQLRERIDKLRDARAVLRGEIERRFPDYANLIDPRPATIAEVQAILRPGEAMLSTYVGAEKSFVWAVPNQGPTSFAALPMGEHKIAEEVAELRKALDPNAVTLGEIPSFDVAAAHRLYSQLVEPVAAGLAGARSLILVPDKALGQLPFGLLVTEASVQPEDGNGALFAGYKRVPFLIRKMAVTQLPSVAALATLRRVPAGNPTRQAFVGFGDPWFSPDQARLAQAESRTQVASLTPPGLQTRGMPLNRRNAPTTSEADSAELSMLPRLPDTADEVRSVATALKANAATDVFLGAAANEQQVRTMNLADRKVVMFATHGLVPGDLNGLTQPALALSTPALAEVEGDGLLTMDEILGLKLNADWVVLSACNTASGEGAGAEAVSGLGRAFFYAGTRALLVSNWPVETTSARMLTTDLFQRQATDPSLSRAKAMQQAMSGMIDGEGYVDQGKTVFSYAHPIFWAPFSVVGDGGGGTPGS